MKSDQPIGKFEVLGTLGHGAHSTILHIRRAADRTNYALKVVPIDGPEDRKFLEQARLEYRVASRLDHPQIVKIYALEEQSDWLFRVRKAQLLIEFVDGKPLDLLPKIPVRLLLPLFVQVASALVHFHRQGIFHADLKPNNLMLGRDGNIKLIDFGLAWIKGEPKGRIQGTPEYMAPETARDKIVSEKSDLYNFGATMYRLLTGVLPPRTLPEPGGLELSAKTFQSLLQPVRSLNDEVPEELAEIVHRCLSFDPHERPRRASEVQGELDRLADSLAEANATSGRANK